MEEYDSDDENYIDKLTDDNKSVELARKLYKNPETKDQVETFLISKIEDRFCKNAGKFALIYYEQTKDEWVKELMISRSRDQDPCSFTALQFTILIDINVEVIKIGDYEYGKGVDKRYKNLKNRFLNYLESGDEEIQFETIRFLIRCGAPVLCYKDYIMRILRNPNHKYYAETAMCSFPAFLSVYTSEKCSSCKLRLFYTGFFCMHFCCLPCIIVTSPCFLYNYSKLRQIFFTCVNIMNSFLQNKEHPKSFDVAKYVIYLFKHSRIPYTLNMINYSAACDIVKDAFLEGTRREEAEFLMKMSGDEDLTLFVMNNSHLIDRKYKNRVKRFNFEKIRDFMPRPLCDIRHIEMNLISEFEKLLDLISDENNKTYYIPIRTVDDSIASYSELRVKIVKFIKNLESNEHEIMDWVMYEEHKDEMVNSLKHIILNINEELERDPEKAMISFSILINGFLHCSSGQFEAVEMVTDVIIRNRNLNELDLRKLVCNTVIYNTIQKKLNVIFNGDVHSIAGAKKHLKRELGLNFAISNFEERIGNMNKDSSYESFFNVFTVNLLIQEFRNYLQTEEDYESILKRTPESNEIKKRRPINVGMIVSWLHDNNFCFNGISDDYKSISDYGILYLLMKMEFISNDDKNLRLLDRLRIKHHNDSKNSKNSKNSNDSKNSKNSKDSNICSITEL